MNAPARPARPPLPKLIPAAARLPDFGGRLIAGVDEAGRGALAGPVVAAAVVFDPARPVDGCADSKTLDAATRNSLAKDIRRGALAWSVAAAAVEEIYRLNILHATLLAMARALNALAVAPDCALIDGNRCPDLGADADAGASPDVTIACCAVVGGDARVGCISAASILAKTERDRRMTRLHRTYPAYGFASHKGYPTRAHVRALRAHGACDAHRKGYRPVREVVAGGGAQRHPDAT